MAASRSKSASDVPGRRRRVNTTSLTVPLAMTRTGLWTVSPEGSVTSWSSTPRSLGGVKVTVTRPMGADSATQWSARFSMDVPRPWAHAGRLAGFEA